MYIWIVKKKCVPSYTSQDIWPNKNRFFISCMCTSLVLYSSWYKKIWILDSRQVCATEYIFLLYNISSQLSLLYMTFYTFSLIFFVFLFVFVLMARIHFLSRKVDTAQSTVLSNIYTKNKWRVGTHVSMCLVFHSVGAHIIITLALYQYQDRSTLI